ncbi:UNVERIFIED_ORG: hypothetical protein M2402_004695 [Rahnella aquatilis]
MPPMLHSAKNKKHSGFFISCPSGKEYHVGKAFIKERLGIEEEAVYGIYSVWWYKTKIGVIDLIAKSIKVGKHC